MAQAAPDPRDETGWSVARYQTFARFVPELAAPVVALLDPKKGERVLDLGCGDGFLTRKIAQEGAKVLGVDADPAMVAAARASGIDAQQIDAHHLPFEAAFDAVFSNAAMHWMTSPDSVMESVFRALKPGGRFVGELGAHANIAAIRATLIALFRSELGIETDFSDIWWKPGAKEFTRRATKAGFLAESIATIPRPTTIASSMRDWLQTLAAPAIIRVPKARRDDFLALVEATLTPILCEENGQWWVDYVRLRFRLLKGAC